MKYSKIADDLLWWFMRKEFVCKKMIKLNDEKPYEMDQFIYHLRSCNDCRKKRGMEND